MIADATMPSGAEGLLMVPLIMLLVFLAVLAVLMPYFVWRISKHTAATNKLLRQLLKAYGHEPQE